MKENANLTTLERGHIVAERIQARLPLSTLERGHLVAERTESVIFWLEAQRDEYPDTWTGFMANALDEMKDLRLINREVG